MQQAYEAKGNWKKLDGKLQCNLCPHNCVIKEGGFGLCKTRKNIGGKLYSLAYGRPCSIHMDPVEKKPLYHFYPGSPILSMGTFGCNLFCRGCQNYEISRAKIEEHLDELEYHEPQEIVDMAKDSGAHMIAYTYNEPTVFYEYMLEIAKIARENGIKNVMVSNGFINEAPLKELLKYMDAANIDIKGFTPEFYKRYTGSRLDAVMDTIKTIARSGCWIELTNLMIPGLNDDPEDIRRMCRWIASIDRDIPLHFSRFFPYYEAEEIEVTPEKTLRMARDIAHSEGLHNVYIGNVGELESTTCPKCKSIVIDREEYPPKLNMQGNKCANCGTEIKGRFW